MSKKEQQSMKVPVFGTIFDLSQPGDQVKAIAKAEKEKEHARQIFEQARRYLMLCTRRVQDIKAQIHYGKEVCHG